MSSSRLALTAAMTLLSMGFVLYPRKLALPMLLSSVRS